MALANGTDLHDGPLTSWHFQERFAMRYARFSVLEAAYRPSNHGLIEKSQSIPAISMVPPFGRRHLMVKRVIDWTNREPGVDPPLSW